MTGKNFTNLVADGKPTAKVLAVQDNLVLTGPLTGAKIFADVLFAGGARGVVWQIDQAGYAILPLTRVPIKTGEQVVEHTEEFRLGVGHQILGRVVNPLGKPLDGGGFVEATAHVPYFRAAPTFGQRDELSEQLETGVTLVDTLLPVVKGQRIAIMGDSKSGKTGFLSQAAIHQAKKGKIVIYVLVAKRRQEMNRLIERFKAAGALKNIVLVVTTSSDPLSLGARPIRVTCSTFSPRF
jgi:F-type H+-transporting ATPase subunit alpha